MSPGLRVSVCVTERVKGMVLPPPTPTIGDLASRLPDGTLPPPPPPPALRFSRATHLLTLRVQFGRFGRVRSREQAEQANTLGGGAHEISDVCHSP